MFVVRVALLAGFMSLSCAAQAAAQAAVNPDVGEITSYKLTLPVLKQVVTATRNLITAMPSDPRFQRVQKLKAEMETLGKKEEPTDAEMQRMQKLNEEIDQISESANILGGNKSLAEIDAAANKDPLVSAALKSAGISAREFAKFFGAFMQASMLHGFQKAGTIKELPKEANLDNIKFVEQHSKEIEAFMKEMQELGKKTP